jgi:hypothetical protein
MERLEMSQEERDKLEWLKRAKDGVITQREAARKMGVTDRWVRKLLLRMNKCGDAVVVHGLPKSWRYAGTSPAISTSDFANILENECAEFADGDASSDTEKALRYV